MEKLLIIKDNEGIKELLEYLKDKTFVAFDTETTGVTKDSEIIGYSICAESDVAYYVITAYWNVEGQTLSYLETKDTASTVMEALKGKQLVMHNGIFDCSMVWNNYKVQLINSLHTDTMILAHLIDENRQVGLKELGAKRYGDSAKKEQEEMKESVKKNGGTLTRALYELYKGDADLIAKYGAKDTILTFNLFYELVPELYEDKMDKFFYEDESMPLLKGPTYDLNTEGLKIDLNKLSTLKKDLEIEILSLKDFIYKEITPLVKDMYPATSAKNTFNTNSGTQLAWLIYERLDNTFPKLSDAGKELCRTLELRNPYTSSDKQNFIKTVTASKGILWRAPGTVRDLKTGRMKGRAEVKDYWHYLSTDKISLKHFASKYKWIEKLLELKKLIKLLTNYVEGIEAETRYGVIHPSFLQHGTTSGRYSCRRPNFQNLPRDDKRVKNCVISRPGCVFVGADYSQLEPRVFASYSQDKRLLECFRSGTDFYSTIGIEIFDKRECSLDKKSSDFFGKKHETLRNKTKVVALSATYGTTAHKMAVGLESTVDEAQRIITDYFEKFPGVEAMMLEAHELVKKNGYVESLYGRKRRIPEAKDINHIFGNSTHSELPYSARNLLNLAVNHRIQSTAASIMNRAAIAIWNECKRLEAKDPRWAQVKIVLQVHDEIILEGPECLSEQMVIVVKNAMENTVELPGVALLAEPKIATNLADLK